MLNKYSGILVMFFVAFSSYSQSDSADAELIIDRDVSSVNDKKSKFYLAGQVFNAYRHFEDLSTSQKFDSLSAQESVFTGGLELGMHMDLTDHFFLSIGANYFGGGETWEYNDSLSDSTFMYVNKYRQIAVPIRLNIQFGEKLKGYGFVGAIPSSILKRRFESSFLNSEGTLTENDIISSEENINSFQFIGSVGGGISYNIGSTSVFAQIEYRHHFTNTYSGLFLSHNQKLLGGSVGLCFSL